jgi:hypothetical protein
MPLLFPWQATVGKAKCSSEFGGQIIECAITMLGASGARRVIDLDDDWNDPGLPEFHFLFTFYLNSFFFCVFCLEGCYQGVVLEHQLLCPFSFS